MNRREFITLIGGAATVWPITGRAQQPTMPVIGYLNSTSPHTYSKYTDAFRRGLKNIWVCRGQNCRDHIPLGGRSKMIDCQPWRLI